MELVSRPIQFAVVREDPEVETALLRQCGLQKSALLIASGGCTAFTLRSRFPESKLTLLDPNPAQLDLIRRKIIALADLDREKFVREFVECGNFESLFKGLRQFIYEFVLPREEWLKYFSAGGSEIENVFRAKYWPVAFQLYFSDALLVTMFGGEAVQHAEPGSYPLYFQKVIERGLLQENFKSNYFLHHILLGTYLAGALPDYFSEWKPSSSDFEFVQAHAQDLVNFSSFDLISLSNIFDWMNSETVAEIGSRINAEAKPGACLVYRQLNNTADVRRYFPGFQFDNELARRLYAQDRSLFYSSLHIGRKVKL